MPPTKAAVSLFPLMPSWKGLQIFINIPINKEKLQTSSHHQTEDFNGHEVERQKGLAMGRFVQDEATIIRSKWVLQLRGHWLSRSILRCTVSVLVYILAFGNPFLCLGASPGSIGMVCENVADWGNVIKWIKEGVRTWVSTTQSIVS